MINNKRLYPSSSKNDIAAKDHELPILLVGKIIAINTFKHGSEYVVQVEIDIMPCDRVNNKYLKTSFEKFFKSFQEHREFYGNFYLDLEVVVEGFLDENLKYRAKNIYFKGGNDEKN